MPESSQSHPPFASTPEAALQARIGQTPLIRLFAPVENLSGITLLAKAEWMNPGGNSKDRAAAAMLADAQARGLLRPGQSILEATSGNMGVSLAMLGALLGIPVHLTLPADASPAYPRLFTAYGASFELTPAAAGLDGAILRARELAGQKPEHYCLLDQFSNDANWLAHYRSTGPEIWQQTEGRLTHFVAGVGSGGTFLGTARKLKEMNPLLTTVCVQPEENARIAGLCSMHAPVIPAIYNPHLASREVLIGEAEARASMEQMARCEGLLVSPASAAVLAACAQIAREEAEAGREAIIATLLGDSGERHLNQDLKSDA